MMQTAMSPLHLRGRGNTASGAAFQGMPARMGRHPTTARPGTGEVQPCRGPAARLQIKSRAERVAAAKYDTTSSVDWDGMEPRMLRLPEMPAAARKYASLLPPFWERKTTVFELVDGLWYFEQPLDLGTGDMRVRMTVLRLSDGRLWVHSPVALTEECRRALASIGGQVSHIVVPSLAPQHWLYASVYARHYPGAELWVPPGLVEMNEEFEALENFGMVELKQLVEARPRILGYSVPPAWRADIETAMFICPMYVEAAFCMKNFGVLVTSDLCFGTETQKSRQNQKDDRGWWAAVTQMPFKAASMFGRLGSPVAFPIFNSHKEEALAWVMQIAEMDFDIVLPAHFDAPIYNGKRQLIDCFDYVLGWDRSGSSGQADRII